MPEAKKIRIFRVSLAGDDQTTTDRIDFNDPNDADFKDPKKEGAYIVEYEVETPHAVGDHAGVGRDIGGQQSLGQKARVHKIKILITKRDGNSSDGLNTYLILLELWNSELKKIKGTWDEGRFGIVDDNDNTHTLLPVGTGSAKKGPIWQNMKRKTLFQTNQEEILLELRESRGDGT